MKPSASSTVDLKVNFSRHTTATSPHSPQLTAAVVDIRRRRILRSLITKAREDEDSMAFQREFRGDSTNLPNFTSREVSLEEREILNCRDGLVPRRYGITGARERQREVWQQTELPLLQYSH